MAEGSRSLPTGPTIRAQAKSNKSKSGGNTDKEIVRASLASPLIVPWPNLPRHLQRTLIHALPQIVPPEVADYHATRQRCHVTAKRERAKEKRRASKAEALARAPADPSSGGETEGDRAESSKAHGKRPAASTINGRPPKKPKTASLASPLDCPTPPLILEHLVLGINEVLKALERQIGELRIRIMQMGDALNGQLRPSSSSGSHGAAIPASAEILPTAPTSVDLDAQAPFLAICPPKPSLPPAGLMWIFIPLGSINPLALVQPIPQYCATYNTLVFQYVHLAKVCRTRLPAVRLEEVLGKEPEEVRVVPMGRAEGEMAELVGLRRMAALGVKASHPSISTLHGLLPKSVLHPPRLSLTLPLPTNALHIYNGKTSTVPPTNPSSSTPASGVPALPPAPAPAPAPAHRVTPAAPAPNAAAGTFIHYAPLHVKGITTTIPADGNARKAKRMEEVRARRRDIKEKKRLGKMGKKEARKAREAAGAGITA